MRLLAFLTLIAAPASAWQAEIGVVCTLSHQDAQGAMHLTYDPAIPEYSITVTRAAAEWEPGAIFAISFAGPRGLTISTTRQQVRGADVTVTDSGFSNVLDGLEFNETATASLGTQTVTVSLDGAAPAVRAFRACAITPTA